MALTRFICMLPLCENTDKMNLDILYIFMHRPPHIQKKKKKKKKEDLLDALQY